MARNTCDPSTREAAAGEPQGQGQSETHSEAPAHTPNERGKWVGGWDGFCVETSQCRLHTFLVVGMTDRRLSTSARQKIQDKLQFF